jgi:hypothetical protein
LTKGERTTIAFVKALLDQQHLLSSNSNQLLYIAQQRLIAGW